MGSFPKNVHSRIARKHCADLDGFVDVAIVCEGNAWKQTDDPLCQSFVVTDLQRASVDDETMLVSYRQTSDSNVTDTIKSLMQMVDDDFEAIKQNKNTNDDKALSPKDLLDRVTSNCKAIQESMSSLKNRKSKLDEEEANFVKLVETSIVKYNREIRALRFEIKMQ